MQYGECVHVQYRVLSPLIMFICNLGASPPACVSVQMHVCVFKNPASADGLLSLSLSLPNPLLCTRSLLFSLIQSPGP